MLRVGLTGNLGAGKSTVAELFASWGATVIDADDLAREVVAPGQPALAKIREIWGDEVIAEDGTLDRAALRRIVFTDAEQRRRLEALLHPPILGRFRKKVAEAEELGERVVVGVVPLLYETGMEDEFDVVVLVDAPLERRLERIVSLRGLSREEAREVAASQMLAGQKRRLADFIIDNDSDVTTLERRAWETWKEIDKLTPER